MRKAMRGLILVLAGMAAVALGTALQKATLTASPDPAICAPGSPGYPGPAQGSGPVYPPGHPAIL